MYKKSIFTVLLTVVAVFAFGPAFAGVGADVFSMSASDAVLAGSMLGVIGNTKPLDQSEIQAIIKQMTGIESSMASFQEKAVEDIKATGKVAETTIESLDKLGIDQKEIADRLLALEQSGGGQPDGYEGVKSMGDQFTGSDAYAAFKEGSQQKARIEIQSNINTGGAATVQPDRKDGIVAGEMQVLTLESLLVSLPTTGNAIEYTRESSFVNNAQEVLESGVKPETDIVFELKTDPVRTIAHWTKISRQLADDAPALAAYINFRMTYGVNVRAENAIAAGDGIGANISGLLNAANYTAHGIADAVLGSVLKKHVLIRKVIAQLRVAGYMADAVILNPIDYADLEIEAATAANVKGIDFGVPVIQSNGVTQGQFLVGAFQQGATVHNRQGVVVELSESDSDNFTKNLITVRAERRLALSIEVPAALMGGDLTPA